jgi:hypothetical protein
VRLLLLTPIATSPAPPLTLIHGEQHREDHTPQAISSGRDRCCAGGVEIYADL